MTSPATTEISSCVLCKSTEGKNVFTCVRCSKKTLVQQLDELTFEHSQLQLSHESGQSVSMAKIDAWESESIEKIQCMALDMRKVLRMECEKHTHQFSKRWKELSEELKSIRNNNDWMEIGFEQLSNQLNKLKAYLATSPTIDFEENMLIAKPIISTIPNDIFEMFAGDLQINDNGQLVEHGPSVTHAIVRGSGEYSSGEHRFQFKIETYNINKWIFFGIISHKATMCSNTWAIPSCYGWGGQDSTILNCAMHSGLNGYSCDFQLNDIVELLLDCDHRIIRLTNNRTKQTYVMNIDLAKCPFPWHFLLNLFYPKDRVRILYADIQ